MAELVACGWPLCQRVWEPKSGRGRPRAYCSDECRRRADAARQRAVSQIAHLERQLRRERHWLAALPGSGLGVRSPDNPIERNTP